MTGTMRSDNERIANPYVGPRTFTEAQGKLFFGREREARDLLARVLSERLVLFYAQSGAGKSSLINTRLIPQLREVGYDVLPVGRVGGELPAGMNEVDNIYACNLMVSLDTSQGDPNRFAHLSLSRFLAGLTSEDGEHFTYRGASPPTLHDLIGPETPAVPCVLVIDQCEEIITAHPGHWREREAFFYQLNQAMLDDPHLWVVLTLREDYVAALDPYAPLMADRLRARFYMERMGLEAALEAICRPAELGGRPFAPNVAEALRNDLCQVRVPGREEPVIGQYVEPVQLQVVCFQLWERLKARPPGKITVQDLEQAGDVDRALADYYDRVLAAVLSETAIRVDERQLRDWFSKCLITEAGTRGLVRQGRTHTGDLPNSIAQALQKRFVVRAEVRSSDTWYELVHDRFVNPILQANRAWAERTKASGESRSTLAERFLEEQESSSAVTPTEAGERPWTDPWAAFQSAASWTGERLRDAAMWPVNVVRYLPVRLGRLAKTLQSCPAELRRGNGWYCLGALSLQLLDLLGMPELLTFLWRAVAQAIPLTGAEIAAVTTVLGPLPVRYEDIRVAEGRLVSAVAHLIRRSVFPLFETINMPRHGPVQRFRVEILLNEVVQVWFYERRGSALAIEWLLASQSTGYDYTGVDYLIEARKSGSGFAAFNRMQQAQILQDYYVRLRAGLDTAAYEPFVAELRAGKF